MKGDSFYQNEAAEKAVRRATIRGNNLVIHRAKGLACDAKFKLGLAEAIQDCNQARDYAARAQDAEGQVRAINLKASILKETKKPDDALRSYQEALALAQRLAEKPRQAIQETKRALNLHLQAAIAMVAPFALSAEAESFATEDVRRSVESFSKR